jgi:xanthine/CO dehydrogenase XdhC/CoxF family maturation factor
MPSAKRAAPRSLSPTWQAASSASSKQPTSAGTRCVPRSPSTCALAKAAWKRRRKAASLPPLNVDRYTAFVALTHDPKIDDPALTHALKRDCFYIGALGSRKTHARRVERLKQQGFSDADIARIQAPIGLDIGAVSPAEIAVAIMAQITEKLREEADAEPAIKAAS